MPRRPAHHAIATKDSIANLFVLAEQQGEVTIHLPSREACFRVRNQIYKHRSALRKQALAHTGVESSPLDGYRFNYGPLSGADGKYWFNISFFTIIEFDIIIPDHWDLEANPLPHFDTPDAPPPPEDDDIFGEPPPPEDESFGLADQNDLY